MEWTPTTLLHKLRDPSVFFFFLFHLLSFYGGSFQGSVTLYMLHTYNKAPTMEGIHSVYTMAVAQDILHVKWKWFLISFGCK